MFQILITHFYSFTAFIFAFVRPIIKWGSVLPLEFIDCEIMRISTRILDVDIKVSFRARDHEHQMYWVTIRAKIEQE